MSDTLLFSALTGPGRDGLRPSGYVRAILRFEAALAAAQASLGLIPEDAAGAIERAAAAFDPDVEELARCAHAAGTPVVELLRQVGAHLDTHAPGAREYLHHGATSQDAMDTAMALCVSPLVAAVTSALDRGRASSVALALRHATDPMLARTLMQPAGVITFGFKAAQWAAALDRSASRIREASARALCLQLAGSVGTGAAFGGSWADLQAAVAARLGLRAVTTWQSLRDEWLNLFMQLGLAVGVAAKIAGDLVLLGQAEVGEVHEPPSSTGPSSAMPHKRNPVLGLRIRGCWHVTNGLLAGLVPTLAVEQERGLGTWQAELALAAPLVESAVSAAESLAVLLDGLEFDGARARHNIDETRGQVFSERAVQHLAGVMRPMEARRLVEQTSAAATASGLHLRAALVAAVAGVPGALSSARADALLAAAFDTQAAAAPAAAAAERLLHAGFATGKEQA